MRSTPVIQIRFFRQSSARRSIHTVVIGREQFGAGLGQRFLTGQAGQMMDSGVDAFGADRFGEAHPGEHAFKNGAVVGAYFHEAGGVVVLVVPASRNDRGP